MENLKNDVSKTITGDWTQNIEKFVQTPISLYDHQLPFVLPQTTSQNKVQFVSFDSSLDSVATKFN